MQDNENIETFSSRRRLIHFGKLPEMLFFDTDEEEGEAPFIRVDDLFKNGSPQMDNEKPAQHSKVLENTSGATVVFTLIPRHRYQHIDETLSKIVTQSLTATSIRESIRLIEVIVRPVFIQWKAELPKGADAHNAVRKYRRALEYQLAPYRPKDTSEEDSFLADDCLILPMNKELSEGQVIRFVNRVQKEEL